MMSATINPTMMRPGHSATSAEPGPISRSRRGVASVLPFLSTYGIVFIFIFFVMGGYLPTPSTRISSLQATSSSSDTVFGQLFQAVTWAFAVALMFPYYRQILRTCNRMKAMVFLSLLAIFSVVWSQDPSGSLRRGVFLTLGTAFAFYLTRRFTMENLAQIVVVTGVIAGVLGILVSAGLPSYGRDMFNGGAWQGIFRSKNGCGQIMLFFFSAAVCFRFKSRGMRGMRLALFPITLLLIVMSKAATAYMLAPGLMLLVGFLTGLRRYEKRNVVFIIAAAISLILLAGFAMPYIMPFMLHLLNKDPSMSGRMPLWKAVIASAMKRPMLGYGYAAFWTGLRGESLAVYMATHFEIYQAQNGILEVWVELGLVGVLLFVSTLVRATKDALVCLQHGYSPVTNWCISLIALTVVYNIDETFIASAHSLPWLLYIVACTGLADRARQLRSAGANRRRVAPPPIQSKSSSICPNGFAGSNLNPSYEEDFT